ncbi:MAG: hypothetical protein ACHQKY_04465 [Terriglobia bacterium]
MKSLYLLFSLARADFLERARRSSYLLTLGFSIYLAVVVYTGKIVLKLNEYRGVPESTWFAASMQLVCIIFISLFGFYIVKNGIERDEQTRVGRILAATPLSKPLYTVGKTISNFFVLASMVLVLTSASVLMPLLQDRAETDYGVLIFPFLFVALPCMSFVGSLAVFFECVPLLRGGVGNVVYFFLWMGLLILGIETKTVWFDFSGVSLFFWSMDAALQKVAPGSVHGLQLNPGDTKAPLVFPWNGIHWTPALVAEHFLWIAVALGIAYIAAVFFHRFDPSLGLSESRPAARQPLLIPQREQETFAAASTHLTPLPSDDRGGSLTDLVLSELKLMLKGVSRWWYCVAAGLFIASLVTPLAMSHELLVAVWIWPLMIWSQMGTRESRYATTAFIFSAPSFLWRQLPAVWLAGVIVTFITGSGVLLRSFLRGDLHAILSWLVAAFLIPTLALALGIWSGGPKTFEVVYLLWWYVGPLNRVPSLDFMGISPGAGHPLMYVLMTTVLLAASFLGRSWRPRYL